MSKTITSLLSVVGLVNLLSLGCGAKPSQQRHGCSAMDEVSTVLKLLEESPDPSLLDEEDVLQRRRVITALRRIAQRDLYVIREAVLRYESKMNRSVRTCDDRALARLFVLNKYLFNCPEKADVDVPAFGAWVGVPYDDEHVNLMWPLGYDEHGRIVLTSTFGAYLGEPYAATAAFDYYRKTYGRRPGTSAREGDR